MHQHIKLKQLLACYIDVLRAYGSDAKFISKSRLYEMAGERVYLSPLTSAIYLRKMLKNKEVISQLDREDLELLGK